MRGKVASLFAGIGGLDYGFIQRRYDIAFVNEFHKNTALSYEMIHGMEVNTTDINDLNFDDIPDCDILIGGPPCQSFSLVGKRKSDDPRGKCVFKFLEAVKQKSPTAFVMENVPGIRSSKIGDIRLIDFLKKEFKKFGYQVNEIKMKAIEYGVPQRRKESFFLGQ